MTLKPLAVGALMLGLASGAYAQIDTRGLKGQPLIDLVTQEVVASGYGDLRVTRNIFGKVRVLGVNGDKARLVSLYPGRGRVEGDVILDWPQKQPAWDPNAGPDFADIEGNLTH